MNMEAGMGAIAPDTGKVYYTGKYWNDFPGASKEINRRATGDANQLWYDHFFAQHPRKFKKVLMLNCGNGWPEREMHQKGHFAEAEVVGVDYMEDLLSEAREQAQDLPFRYYRMDINKDDFPETGFDLVINHAAGHHIAHLDKVFRQLLQIMTDDGVFLNYDYVGAHRNQYPIHHWQAVFEVNNQLPESTRQVLSYPHLPTMLATDPSEAVHAELILPVMKRYFTFDFFTPTGGTLAYPILTHNEAIQKASKPDVKKAVAHVMQADGDYIAKHPDQTMFAYWVARPNKAILKDSKKLRHYQTEEAQREEVAAKRGGHYYDLDLIQQLYLELDELRIAKQHKQSSIEELQQETDRLKAELVEKSRSTLDRATEKVKGKLSAVKQRVIKK